MNKLWKFLQYGYLIIAIICLVEGIIRWSTDRSSSSLFFGVSVLVTLLFFFKRHFRKKVEARNQQNRKA